MGWMCYKCFTLNSASQCKCGMLHKNNHDPEHHDHLHDGSGGLELPGGKKKKKKKSFIGKLSSTLKRKDKDKAQTPK